MECPTCKGPVLPDDRFCGTCGERLSPKREVPPGPPAGIIASNVEARHTADRGSAVAAGEERGVHPSPAAVPNQQAAAEFPPSPAPVQPAGHPTPDGVTVCPIHGEMDPRWTRCPHCLQEGREGRLPTPSGSIPRPDAQRPASGPGSLPAAAQASSAAPPQPPALQPAAPQPAMPQPAPPQPVAAHAGQTPAAAGQGGEVSSVGRTLVVRRRTRTLAYLIEKAGDQVGRVFQLEPDVTDIGRDPRNSIVLDDGMVSGFHLRVERGPNGELLATDRNSTNGSRLNGEPLTDPRPIEENDELGLGNTTLVLKVVS